ASSAAVGGLLTTTTRSTVGASFPSESVTSYLSAYVPGVDELTEPDTTIEAVISPSSGSLAVAPGSSNASPCAIFSEGSPISVMLGGLFGLTLTVRWAESLLPSVSVTEELRSDLVYELN